MAKATITVTSLRLLADDLTGALDTAAELVGITGPVHAFWHGAIPSVLPENAALDSGTWELDIASAVRIVSELAPTLNGAAIPFKKIDSLMRGPTLAEVAACLRAGNWQRGVLAPAFPYQRRITRGGIQHARDHAGHWAPVGGDIVAGLREQGVTAQPGRLDIPLPPGISVFDAESDEALSRVVALGRATPGPVLWIGTGGLAQALADCSPSSAESPLPLPLLGLFGSDHPVTAQQLEACGSDWLRLREGGPGEAAAIAARFRATGRAVVSIGLPHGLGRDEAARRIATELNELVGRLPSPGTLLVGGGETLRGLCLSLGASSLEVQGCIVPGLPRSVLCGGAWDGVTVVSKSGAFGHPHLLRDLLRGPHFPAERTT
jgi:D-threonate/D-erythronate kinase